MDERSASALDAAFDDLSATTAPYGEHAVKRPRVGAGIASGGYREALGAPAMRAWLAVAAATKLPVAMAPLALVFLVRSSAGGYTLGAVLGGAYVVGEVAGALLLGSRLHPARLLSELRAGLLVGAAAFAGLAVSGVAPAPVLVVLALLAGGAPAANAGGLRAALIELAGEDVVGRALSIETTLTQVIWTASPAIVVLLAVGVFPGAPLGLAAACALAAAFGLRRLPSRAPRPDVAPQPAAPARRTLLTALVADWPIYLTSAAAMALLAAAELVLPALLHYRHLPVGWSGPLLAAFSLASALGSLVYGMRRWPGTARTQGLPLLVLMAAFVALSAVLPGLTGIAAGLLLAGTVRSGVMVTRNLALREQTPKEALAAGYSIMYAAQGVGYSLTAVVAAVALAAGRPVIAILSAAGLTLLLTMVSALAEFRPRSRTRSGPIGPGARRCSGSPRSAVPQGDRRSRLVG